LVIATIKVGDWNPKRIRQLLCNGKWRFVDSRFISTDSSAAAALVHTDHHAQLVLSNACTTSRITQALAEKVAGNG
jgi:hypothetical protein